MTAIYLGYYIAIADNVVQSIYEDLCDFVIFVVKNDYSDTQVTTWINLCVYCRSI